MKLQPTFFVNVKLWLHSDMCIWAPSSQSQRTLRVQVWGPSGTLVKQWGSYISTRGTKGPSITAQVHRDHNVSNPIAKQSIILLYQIYNKLRFFRAFSSVVRQMPGYNQPRQGTARTLPNCCVVLCIVCVVLCIVCAQMCTVLLPPGDNPIAVIKCINIQGVTGGTDQTSGGCSLC